MANYKPISLGNVVSRILSKVIANRLKQVLPMVISDAQSAFVSDWLITDDMTIAYELLHRMRNKCRGKVGQMVVKLDIGKAYDRVEWPFLGRIMLKLGLDRRWVSLALETFTTASYLVLINGEPRGFVNPTRGIKQGDPLSPYLFLLCAEGLSALLKKAKENHALKGVLSSQHGVCISHLLNVWALFKGRIQKRKNEASDFSFSLIRCNRNLVNWTWKNGQQRRGLYGMQEIDSILSMYRSIRR